MELRQAKLGEEGRSCKGIDMLEILYATQQVRVLTGQGWPPSGTECCVVQERFWLRSVHRESVGCVIEPRKIHCCGADAVFAAEGLIAAPSWPGVLRSAGVGERGMQARVVQEPGRSRLLHRMKAARAPR